MDLQLEYPDEKYNNDKSICLQNAKYYCEDISEGKERTPVSCINELQDQPPPTFSYCIDRVCSDDVIINTDQSFLIGCDCTDGCRVSF